MHKVDCDGHCLLEHLHPFSRGSISAVYPPLACAHRSVYAVRALGGAWGSLQQMQGDGSSKTHVQVRAWMHMHVFTPRWRRGGGWSSQIFKE